MGIKFAENVNLKKQKVFLEFHLVGMFSGDFWGLLISVGDVVGAACWRQNSWNSVMIILLLLTLPCNRGSSWPSTEGEYNRFAQMQFYVTNLMITDFSKLETPRITMWDSVAMATCSACSTLRKLESQRI